MFEMLIVFLLGGLFGVPLSVPPAEPDPYLSQVAPPEPLYYVEWSGVELPEGDVQDQDNLTLRLAAEPEVQHFIKTLDGVMAELLSRVDESGARKDRPLALFLGHLGRQMLIRPASVAVEELALGAEGLEARATLLVKVDADRKQLEFRLNELCDGTFTEEYGWQVETIELHGETYREIKINPAAPPLLLGFHGDYFFAGMGRDSLDAIVEREGNEPPAWLTQLKQDLHVDRPATVAYLDVTKIRERIEPLAQMIPDAGQMLDAAGIDNLLAYRCVTGLDGDGFAIRTHFVTDGELQMLKFFSPAPITEDDLRRVPADTPACFATKLDALALGRMAAPLLGINRFDDVLRDVSDGMADDFGVGLEELFTDILGDTVVVYAAPRDGGLTTGWLASVPVNRPMEAQMVLSAVLERVTEMSRGQMEVEIVELDEATVYVLETMPDAPFRFTFAVTDTELIASMFPQPVFAHLKRSDDGPSLADNELIASAYSADDMQGGGLRMVLHIDHAEVIQLTYPLFTLLSRDMFAELEDTELPFTAMDLPSTGALTRHLEPSTIILVREDDGYHWEVRQTFPTGDIVAALPIIAVATSPAMIASRAAAGRAASVNNLKQIAIAWHNFHDVYNGFPARASLSPNGKELLSWRVHILPFIEQQALYEQFHLDEPWDSEHNRQLIEMMPAVYARPGTDPSEGLTSYLANAIENGVCVEARRRGGPPTGIGFGQILDGSSNTAMMVEVNDDSRVTWTQPGDFESLEMDPMSRLLGNWSHGWLMGMADGSVHVCREDLTEDELELLFDRQDGGNVPFFQDR
ncbi:MAG: DUF1559 domain-containing protein [Pirellulaceae bacterium]